jgi:hypothetical protein
MLEKLHKYIYDNISEYICMTNIRICCKKFNTYGKCKILKLSCHNFKYIGCSIHSNVSFNVINELRHDKSEYKFKTNCQRKLARKILCPSNVGFKYKHDSDSVGSIFDFQVTRINANTYVKRLVNKDLYLSACLDNIN